MNSNIRPVRPEGGWLVYVEEQLRLRKGETDITTLRVTYGLASTCYTPRPTGIYSPHQFAMIDRKYGTRCTIRDLTLDESKIVDPEIKIVPDVRIVMKPCGHCGCLSPLVIERFVSKIGGGIDCQGYVFCLSCIKVSPS